MDEKLFELKIMETITDSSYELTRVIFEAFSLVAFKKSLNEFVGLPEEEKIKLLDNKIECGKVYEILSKFLTETLNKKIETESAINAYNTEKGEKNGTKQSS